MQFNQDAGKVVVDTRLAQFDHTKRFLEGILDDICKHCGIPMADLVTENARNRLVMASGGTPRDYVNLVHAALTRSTQRAGNPSRPANRISAEDVNDVAPDFFQQRETDLQRDTDQKDVGRLRDRFNDILNFCINDRRINVFLVEARALEEDQWGQDIGALADLRFVHHVGNVTVKSGDSTYTGHRYEAFALDLSSYAGTRVTKISEIQFWTPMGKQELRGVQCVYSPRGAKQARSPARVSELDLTALPSGKGIQLSFDE